MDTFFSLLEFFEHVVWVCLGVPLIVFLGLYLTYQSGFFQIRKFPEVFRIFYFYTQTKDPVKGGVHPLKAFFASVGGCVGVGNIVSICTAVQIGGPGALLWIWLTALIGGMLKYSEVYLGLKYREPNGKGGFNGGPVYYLKKLFNNSLMPNCAAVLLCIYGVEIYQFNVVTENISHNFALNHYMIAAILLGLVIFAAKGGVRRVGAISSVIIPVFVLIFLLMGLWVALHNLDKIPSVIVRVFIEGFTGSAAAGAFVGSSMMMALSQGVRRGCYSSDLGVGYASVIYSESAEKKIGQQAALVLFDVFIDTFIVCTTSILIILSTNVWSQDIEASLLVQTALSQYFPYMHFFMPIFVFLLGYSTINAYLCVGLKCAQYLSPKRGETLYFLYAIFMFTVFGWMGTSYAQSVMTIAGGLLLVLNCYAIWCLRHEIDFSIKVPHKAGLTPG